MRKTPNGSKVTSIFQHCSTNGNANIDLSSLYLQNDLEIESVEYEDSEYHIHARSKLHDGSCPYCNSIARKVHSRYTRKIWDLSILGHPVIITLEIRKFFCDNPECKKKTFAEQPGNEVFRYRRRTRRCEVLVFRQGLNQSSESACKLLRCMGIQLSGDTVLRDLHRLQVPKCEDVAEIGVDDWAFRKGVTYGSVIVDIKKREVIDLFGGRDLKSFENWLNQHVYVKTVSRDRSTDYSAAVIATGRDIIEVADRFHLCKNMSECVTTVISSHYADYRRSVRPEEEKQGKASSDIKNNIAINDTPQQSHKKEKVDLRKVMFNEVKRLQADNLKINQIARKLGITRQTVRKYMGMDTLAERSTKVRNMYHLYDNYVEEEYKKGKALSRILQEIKAMGFKGSQTPFYDHYRYLSDGHCGYRSKKILEKMQKEERKNEIRKREPLMPIRQIAQIVEKSFRCKELLGHECGLIEKMKTFEWFNQIYSAAGSFYKCIMGNEVSHLKS